MWLFDCSPSMMSPPKQGEKSKPHPMLPWAENSKYHYTVLGLKGSLKELQDQQIAPYILFNSTMFSDETISSGWHDYANIGEVKKRWYHPFGGGTSIDMAVMREQLEKAAPSVVLMLSDGEIWNWRRIRDDFRQLTQKHYLALIQMGNLSQAAEDLLSWGNPVEQVSEKDDLRKVMIDLTRKSVKTFTYLLNH